MEYTRSWRLRFKSKISPCNYSVDRDKEKITKITSALNLKISVQDSKYTQDSRTHLHSILRQWLPLADSVLEMVAQELPSPNNVSDERIKNLMCGQFKNLEAFNEDTQNLKTGEGFGSFIYYWFQKQPFADVPLNRCS